MKCDVDIRKDLYSNVNIALHNGLEGSVMNATGLFANEAGLEEHLGATEALAANSDNVTIGQLVCFFLVGALSSRLHLRVKVQGDVAELFLDITNDLALRCCGEGVAPLCQNFHQVLCEVTSGEIETQDCMWQRIAFVDRHGVGDTIP